MHGLTNGFSLVDTDPSDVPKAQTPNHPSATSPRYRAQVEARILQEVADGNYKVLPGSPTLVSPLAVVPKPNGDIRLIHDLSQPHMLSLNDFASKEECRYITIAEALQYCTPGSYLASVDLMWAYRSISIQEQEQSLTGLSWTFTTSHEATFLADCRLPFGARKSPAIFNRITQSIQRMMQRKGFVVYCYLDDFLVLAPSKAQCTLAYNTLLQLLRKLGLRINWNKVCDPCQCLTFLGIQIDTVHGTLRLDPHKAASLRLHLQDTLTKTRLSKTQLQSLGGRLNWAANVHPWGRAYMASIFKAIGKLHMAKHKIQLNTAMTADISWWLACLNRDQDVRQLWGERPTCSIYTDSSAVGGGAFCQNDWTYVNWVLDRPYLAQQHINIKELAMAVEATSRWAPLHSGHQLDIFTDNMMTCHILNTRRATNQVAINLLQTLANLATLHDVTIKGHYIPGPQNVIADSISRLHTPGQTLHLSALLSPAQSCVLYYIPHHMSLFSYRYLSARFQGLWKTWHTWIKRLRP